MNEHPQLDQWATKLQAYIPAQQAFERFKNGSPYFVVDEAAEWFVEANPECPVSAALCRMPRVMGLSS